MERILMLAVMVVSSVRYQSSLIFMLLLYVAFLSFSRTVDFFEFPSVCLDVEI